MKKYFTLLLIIIPLFIKAQSDLDLLVFSKINEYRKQNGIHELVWGDNAFNASKHHTKYMIKNKEVGHNEISNTPTAASRLKYYGVDFNFSGENCAMVIIGIIEKYANDEYLATEIIGVWKQSPGHNKNMLNKNYKFGSVSCLKDGNFTYSTLNVYNLR